MNRPFFSIIIPTYNRVNHICLPIESIIAQTFTDWELIVVDDGSTDDTQAFVTSYHDERIRYVWQQNKERSAARNYGISIAQGEWICFQDSDDAYLPHHLEVLYDGIKNNPEYKCIKSGLIIYQDGVEIHRTDIKPTSKYDAFPYEAFTTGSYHRSVFDAVKFDERFYISEDLHFILQVGIKFAFKTLPSWTGITHYNPNNSGRIGKYYEARIINRIACLEDILSWNTTLIRPYLLRQRCLDALLLLKGHWKYRKTKIPEAVVENAKIFLRFPKAYCRLIFRILYFGIIE